jgi:hypothetical protein
VRQGAAGLRDQDALGSHGDVQNGVGRPHPKPPQHTGRAAHGQIGLPSHGSRRLIPAGDHRAGKRQHGAPDESG